MAFRGEEAFRDVYPELCGDFEPYSPSCQGWPGARGYPTDDAVDSRKDGPGIQPIYQTQISKIISNIAYYQELAVKVVKDLGPLLEADQQETATSIGLSGVTPHT